mgnify:CR=1 FL=1
MSGARRWLGLAGWLAVSFVPGVLGGTLWQAGAWYDTLAKPPWTPPSWTFGVVWPLLYLTMGIAAWLVWQRAGWRNARTALTVFLVQLIPNTMWSWLFFGEQRIGWALVDIVVLWLLIVAAILLFRRHRRLAAALLLPYLAWVGYATTLNAAIWLMN